MGSIWKVNFHVIRLICHKKHERIYMRRVNKINQKKILGKGWTECTEICLLFIPTQIWPTKLEDWEFQPKSVQLKIFCKPPYIEKQTYLAVQSAKPQNWRGAFSLAANKAPALETRSTTLPAATVHSSTQQIYRSHPIFFPPTCLQIPLLPTCSMLFTMSPTAPNFSRFLRFAWWCQP